MFRNISYLQAAGIFGWMMMIILSFWLIPDSGTYVAESESRETMLFQVLGVALFLASQLLNPMRLPTSFEPTRAESIKRYLIHSFFAVIAVLACWSVVPAKSGIYVLLTWVVFISACAFWRCDFVAIRRMFTLVSSGYLAVLLALLAFYGLNGRWVGPVQPNQFGTAALIAIVCASFAGPFVRAGSTGLAYGLALLVSSRSSLVALTLYLIVFYLPVAFRSLRLVTLLLLFGGTVLVVECALIVSDGLSLSQLILKDVLLLDDPGRGLGSGITGRDSMWSEGWDSIQEYPVAGLGFRMAGTSDTEVWTHSGFMALLVECGVLAGGLLLAAVVYDLLRRIDYLYWLSGSATQPASDCEASQLVNRCSLAYLSASVFLWAIEPVYLNLGNPISAMFIVLLAAPYTIQRSGGQSANVTLRTIAAARSGGNLVHNH